MSATAFSPPEQADSRPGTRSPGLAMFLVWVVFSVLMAALMWARPGEETIPFHLIYIAFCLLYGFAVWPLRLTVVGIGALLLISTLALSRSALGGAIGWSELSEVPFMAILALLLVWHVRRRQRAAQQVVEAAARDLVAAQQRHLLTRLISHELRTSLTVTTGYTDLIATQSSGRRVGADVRVVSDELTRLNRSVERLIMMIRMQEDPGVEPVDIDALLRRTSGRWVAVDQRRWTVTSDVGLVMASDERLSAALDTLVENALRHTATGDRICLEGRWEGDQVVIEVRDSGRGLSADQAFAINNGDESWVADGTSHSGLGLQIVRQVVTARSGTVVVGSAAEGGAAVVLRMPLARATATRSVATDLPALPRQHAGPSPLTTR